MKMLPTFQLQGNSKLIVATIGTSTDAKQHLHAPFNYYFFELLYIIDRKLWKWKVLQKRKVINSPLGVCIFAHRILWSTKFICLGQNFNTKSTEKNQNFYYLASLSTTAGQMIKKREKSMKPEIKLQCIVKKRPAFFATWDVNFVCHQT